MSIYLGVNQLAKTFPIIASGVFIGARYFAGDSVTQFVEGQTSSKTWDYSRTAVFTVFGFYTGITYGQVLMKWYPRIMKFLRVHRGISGFIVEGFGYIPFLYFPAFYVLQNFRSPGAFSFLEAWRMYKRNIWDDMVSYMKLWPVPMIIAFAVLPHHLIPAFVATFGFLWVLVLSSNRGEMAKLD